MQDFLNFKTLITEKVLKWIYLVLVAISAIATVFAILASWVMAFRTGPFLLHFIFLPVVIVLGVALYMVILRIAFEATLVRFLIYRETKELNEKIGR